MLADIGIELDYISQLLRQTTVSLGTYRATTTKKDKTKSIAGVSLLRWYKTRLFGIQSKWMNISGRPLGATPSVRLQQGFIKPTPVPFGWFGIFFLTNYSHSSVDWCFTKTPEMRCCWRKISWYSTCKLFGASETVISIPDADEILFTSVLSLLTIRGQIAGRHSSGSDGRYKKASALCKGGTQTSPDYLSGIC